MFRILIIEDDRFNRRLYEDLLTEEGFAVATAQNAQDGLAEACASRPDLVVMDIELPDRDGLDATRQLKEMPETAGIPVVVISAHALPEHEARARAVADAFLRKPLRFPLFQETLRRLLGAGNERP